MRDAGCGMRDARFKRPKFGFKPQFNLDGWTWPFAQILLIKCEYRSVVFLIETFLCWHSKCHLKGTFTQAIFRASDIAVLLQHRSHEKLPNANTSSNVLVQRRFSPNKRFRIFRNDCGYLTLYRFLARVQLLCKSIPSVTCLNERLKGTFFLKPWSGLRETARSTVRCLF